MRPVLRAIGVRRSVLFVTAIVMFALPLAAQTPPADPPPAPPARPAEADLTVINLPTTLSIRRHRSAFRMTHRFARDLRNGDFGDLASDLFSLDNGAIIGLEYRFAIADTFQAGIHRSILSKTIQTFARWDAWKQAGRLSLSIVGSVEGLRNMQEKHQPALAATVSHVRGDWLALYATPAYVAHTRAAEFIEGHDHEHEVPGTDEHSDHRDTFFVGLGTRARIRPTAYLVAEYAPRLAGHNPGRGAWGVGIEKRTRGHVLQLNVGNSFATTFGQLARGGSRSEVYLGFNLSRKF
jgi:hypothetical protein